MDWLATPLDATPWQIGFAFAVLLGAALMIFGRRNEAWPGREEAQTRLGLPKESPGLFFLATVLWAALTVILAASLAWLVWDVATHPMLPEAPAGMENRQATWNFRFRIAQLVALTTVLGAVIALPFTLIRLRLQRQANQTADEALFNEKIAEAAADLHARRQKTMRGIDGSKDVWEDDIVRRNAAINRLEGLVEERMRAPVEDATKRDVLIRVSRLIGVYVRELSDELDPVPVPMGVSVEELRGWAQDLATRSDLENAVQTLGRLRSHADPLRDAVVIDLEGANLQGCRLLGLDFDSGTEKSNFHRAQMQGADLTEAQMQGAILTEAKMQGANLFRAQMQGANLTDAQMQGALLIEVRMQGADLFRAQMQGANLNEARMQEADLVVAQMQGAVLFRAQMQGADLTRAEMQWTNLTGAQLQGADLTGAQLQEANLTEAQLQGANLNEAHMQRAYLIGAQMQGANLNEAHMQRAYLIGAQMQGAFLIRAQLQGALLIKARMDCDTDPTAASLRGAAVGSVDDTTIAKLKPFWADVFADGTVAVPEGERPAHWSSDELVFLVTLMGNGIA